MNGAKTERAKIRQRLTLFVLLWLSGACLRLTVLAIPPVVPLLHADLHLSETGIGWLSSLPPMLFAIAAVPGALIIARFGLVPALLVALSLTAAGSALRGAVANVVFLYASTIAMGAGVAIAQTVMPPLVRSWFPQRIGLATTIYTNGLLIGEILPVGLTIPLVLPLVHDSWRLDLVFWSLPVLATALFVAACAPRADTAKAPAPAKRRWWPDWRNSIIWRLGLILGSVNSIYFVSNAFLPDFVIARGRPDLVSSALTAINIGQLPATFLLLGFADRLLRRPSTYCVTGLATFLCLVAMMSMDGWWIVFWAGMEGFTNAVTLILALALPSILSAADDVHRTTAGMFTISYSCAMAFSVLGGWLWDLTHLPIAGFAPVAVCALVVVALSSTVKHAAIQPATAR
ncbi:MAG TPA: MFS transporter [Xanthobacteraceae bacterium]|nr:MFS transporter [Xanthobacteraceae bacterium]